MKNKLLLGTGIVGVVTYLVTGVAAAQSVMDPTGGAYESGVSDVQSFITGTAAGPLFALAAVVLGVTIGLRWLKKARGAAA